jgi:hypothetical protein
VFTKSVIGVCSYRQGESFLNSLLQHGSAAVLMRAPLISMPFGFALLDRIQCCIFAEMPVRLVSKGTLSSLTNRSLRLVHQCRVSTAVCGPVANKISAANAYIQDFEAKVINVMPCIHTVQYLVYLKRSAQFPPSPATVELSKNTILDFAHSLTLQLEYKAGSTTLPKRL